MTNRAYAIQAGALRENPNSGPDGVGVQADIAYTLEARAEVQAVCGVASAGPANDNRPAIMQGQTLSFISMFSGIEAASVAFGPLGWLPICFAEIEKFPSAVLAHHYPDVPNVGNMAEHDWTQYAGKVDIVCGGPPCQDFSIAGLRAGMDGARGNLSITYMRALHAIKPRNAIVENVPGWLNDSKNAFGCFLAGLVGADDPLLTPDGKSWPNAGMVAGPLGRAAWRVLDAQYFGLAQRRRRVLVVADFGNGADPATVLFEPESLCRNPPSRGEAGQSVTHPIAPSIVSSGRGVERTGDTRGQDPVVAVLNGGYAPEIARCVATREGSSQDYESTTMVAHCREVAGAITSNYGKQPDNSDTALGPNLVAIGVTGTTSHSLTAEGADASEDGTGRGTPVVAFMTRGSNIDTNGEISGTIGTNSDRASGGAPMVAQTVAIRGRAGGATAELGGEVATALRASQGGGDKPHVLIGGVPETAGTMMACAQSGGFSNSADHAAAGYMVPVTTSAVRRLTPRECERLQGFQFLCAPDYPGAWQDDAGRWWSPDYTAIPWRGKPAADCPDGPRYKALGNSWAVPKFAWLGARIQRFMPVHIESANDNQPHKESA